jgi:fructosamine-3-kinase
MAAARLGIENVWMQNWPEFWAERRLRCHGAHVGTTLAHRIELLAADIGSRLPQEPKRSLLHGDLWGGNILTANGQVSVLIDPACYYAHNEIDLAMLTFFDSPSAAFYEAYGRLETGHVERRRAIYQLWPALVYLRLFGEAYRGVCEQLLAKAGA